MSPELTAKLTRIQNFKTRYEIIATGPDGTKILAGYTSRKSRVGVLKMVQQHADSWVKVTGDDSIGLGKGVLTASMGDWEFAFSNRTQREAYIGGEVEFITDYVTRTA